MPTTLSKVSAPNKVDSPKPSNFYALSLGFLLAIIFAMIIGFIVFKIIPKKNSKFCYLYF